VWAPMAEGTWRDPPTGDQGLAGRIRVRWFAPDGWRPDIPALVRATEEYRARVPQGARALRGLRARDGRGVPREPKHDDEQGDTRGSEARCRLTFPDQIDFRVFAEPSRV